MPFGVSLYDVTIVLENKAFISDHILFGRSWQKHDQFCYGGISGLDSKLAEILHKLEKLPRTVSQR